MYGHGIALMALEEALCMTRDGNQYDSDLLDLVQQGANFSCIAQHPNGSWGYVPGRPGDVTITGWQVLSLIGSRKGGAALHTNTLPDAKSFLMSTCEGAQTFGLVTTHLPGTNHRRNWSPRHAVPVVNHPMKPLNAP